MDDYKNKFQEENDGMKQNRILKGWFNVIMHSTFFLALIYFGWHDIKDEEICDPMEKIWVKRSSRNKLMNFWIL